MAHRRARGPEHRAAVVGIYPTSIGEELHHILSVGRVRLVVAEDQEQVDKLIKLRADSGADLLVETVVFYDPHGLEEYDLPWLRDFVDVEEAGRTWGESRVGWLDGEIAEGKGSDIAVICTTSGTTSNPKLAELSHSNLLTMGEHLTAVDPIRAKDRYVSFLPFTWIGEQYKEVVVVKRVHHRNAQTPAVLPYPRRQPRQVVGVDDVRPLSCDEVAHRPTERDDYGFDVVAKTPDLARAPMLRVHYDSIAFDRMGPHPEKLAKSSPRGLGR